MSQFIYRDPFLLDVETALRKAFLKILPPAEELEESINNYLETLSVPPEFEFGQAAFPCFALSKTLKMAPVKIAENLSSKLDLNHRHFISKVEVKGGYLNFFAQMGVLGDCLIKSIHKGDFFRKHLIDTHQRKRLIVEFSQPNTHKMVHVGHLRNLVLGETVCHLLEGLGHHVIRVTYPGDLGTHIAKVLWYIRKMKITPPDENRSAWLGVMYADAEAFIRSHPEQEEIIKREMGEVLRDLQEKTGEIYNFYLETRGWSLDFMKDLYNWMGTHFDVWYFESECDEPSRQLVQDFFQKGQLIKSDGAIGYDLSSENLGFALLLKSDGNGLYLTKDLELVRRKFVEWNPDLSILVVDNRQKLHFQQLFKLSEHLGLAKEGTSFHLSYESVVDEQSGKAVSSRERSGLEITQLREKMLEKVRKDYLSKYDGDWSESEIYEASDLIVRGALKYGMLRIDPGSIIKFSLEKWLSLEGDTGPYLQYVFARCASLLLSSSNSSSGAIKNFGSNTISFETVFEEKIIFHLSKYQNHIYEAAVQYKPHILANYLFELCKLFNRFYKECPVLRAPDEIKSARLLLVESVSKVLESGLSLLGIPVIQKM